MATVAAEVEGQAVRPTSVQLTLLPLIALVIGSMIDGGVFNLPSDMSKAAAPPRSLITGIGMLMVAFVYQSLATRKPDLNAGPYACARAGFGDFVGFVWVFIGIEGASVYSARAANRADVGRATVRRTLLPCCASRRTRGHTLCARDEFT